MNCIKYFTPKKQGMKGLRNEAATVSVSSPPVQVATPALGASGGGGGRGGSWWEVCGVTWRRGGGWEGTVFWRALLTDRFLTCQDSILLQLSCMRGEGLWLAGFRQHRRYAGNINWCGITDAVYWLKIAWQYLAFYTVLDSQVCPAVMPYQCS